MSTSITKVWLLTACAAICLTPQHSYAQGVVDGYISQAFSSNEELKQEHLRLDNALNALKQARTLYYPNVSVQGNYTRAAGGRTIDFPIGDLLNPVYGTLNDLTKTNSFPKLENASILLNPDDFYDVKLHTTLPLINAEIWYNQKIKKAAISERTAAVNVYKRELAKNVKEAYYQYYMAYKATEIYNNSLLLINENVRVNKSLVRNGMRNNTVLIRSEAEQQKINASIVQAENNVKNAKLYFNFLLNRPAESDIVLDKAVFADAALQQNNKTPGQREELAQLQAAIDMNSLNRQMKRSYLMPKLNLFADLGSQAFQFQFDNKSRYFFGGVNLQWDLFAAGQNKYKIAAAGNDVSIAHSKYEYTRQAMEMQAAQCENNYRTAYATYTNALTQVQFAQRYYDDEMKIYKEGQALYIELIDALNQLTTAQLQENIARAGILTALAELERQNATYNLDKEQH